MVIECKLLHGSLETAIGAGLEQTRAYMDGCAAAEGHLVIFRPHRRKVVGGEAVSARGDLRRRAGHRVGHVAAPPRAPVRRPSTWHDPGPRR